MKMALRFYGDFETEDELHESSGGPNDDCVAALRTTNI